MSHTVLKFTKGHDSGEEVRGWHLLADELGDGEFTACGLAETEYESKRKVVEKGGVTCEDCLETIRFYKKVKL